MPHAPRTPFASTRTRLLKHSVPQQLIEPPLGHDPHPAAEKRLQLRDESTWKPGTRIRANLDEKVYIAVRSRIAARH